MCIIHCRKYHLHICNRDSICIITINIFTHVFAAETVTCTSVAESSNCITATEIATNIPATESTTLSPDVVTCIIAIESFSSIVPTETATCKIDYRHFHLQKWYQSEILLVEIKRFT